MQYVSESLEMVLPIADAVSRHFTGGWLRPSFRLEHSILSCLRWRSAPDFHCDRCRFITEREKEENPNTVFASFCGDLCLICSVSGGFHTGAVRWSSRSRTPNTRAVSKGGFTTEAQRTQRIGIDLNLGQVGVAAQRSPNSETPDDCLSYYDRNHREDEKELEFENEGFANC